MNSGREEAGFTEAFHNQNRSIFLKIISRELGFTFQEHTAEGDGNEDGGKHAGGGEYWSQPCATESILFAHTHIHTRSLLNLDQDRKLYSFPAA